MTTAKASVPDCTPDRSLTNDLKGFEAQVDCFRRYAVAAIWDGQARGDSGIVRVGRKIFLLISYVSTASRPLSKSAITLMPR
jgi:hypothetical protein